MFICTEKAPTHADQKASRNFTANCAALIERDGAVPTLPTIESAELLFGRDGTLTTKIDGRWLRGCSVPTAAARAQLKSMQTTGQCACLLDPMHAATLQIALVKLRPGQAVIAIVPDAYHAALLLRCAEFCTDISARRCWIVFGETWPQQLHALLQREEGMAIPTQFIRTPSPDASIADGLIGPAQQVFSSIVTERKRKLDAFRNQPRLAAIAKNRLCVVGGQRFKLWNDAGYTLSESMRENGADTTTFDTDNPTCATHLALARAADGCDAIVAADLFRCDSNGAIRDNTPWITWATRNRLPAYADAMPCDGLLVTDESIACAARQSGWPANRIVVATWPREKAMSTVNGQLTLIADVTPLDPPADLEHLSSHRLLWEHVAARVARDPLAAHDRACEVINESISALHLDPASIAIARFIEQLVTPAYAVAIARLLTRAGIEVDLFGKGWECFEDLDPFYRRPVASRSDLSLIINQTAKLLHVWPTTVAHPIEFTHRPVVRYNGGGANSFVADARKGRASPPGNSSSICYAAVLSLL